MMRGAACLAVLVVLCKLTASYAQTCSDAANIRDCQRNLVVTRGTKGCMVPSDSPFTPAFGALSGGCTVQPSTTDMSLTIGYSSANPPTCTSPDTIITLDNLVFTTTLASTANSPLYNIGIWVASMGLSPPNVQSSCHALALPAPTGDNCYFPNSPTAGDSCGDVSSATQSGTARCKQSGLRVACRPESATSRKLMVITCVSWNTADVACSGPGSATGQTLLTSKPSCFCTPRVFNEITVPQANLQLGYTFARVDPANWPGYYRIGDIVTYTVTATNTGNVDLKDILQPTFTLGTISSCVSGNQNFLFRTSQTAGSCNACSSLAVGQAIVCTLTFALTSAQLDAESVSPSFTTDITWKPVLSNLIVAQTTVSSTGSRNLEVPGYRLLTVTNPALLDNPKYLAGETLTLTIEAKNDGDVTINNLQLASLQPAGQGGLSCSGGATSLAKAATATWNCTYRPTAEEKSVVLSATVQGTGVTSATRSKTAELVAMTVDVATAEQSYASTEEFTATVTVTNTGGATLSNVGIALSDLAPTNAASVSGCTSIAGPIAPDATGSCTFKVQPAQPNLDANTPVTLNATATSSERATYTVDSGNKVVSANQQPAMTVDVSHSLTNGAIFTEGQEIDYTVTVTNTGNVKLTGLNVTSITNPAGAVRIVSCDTSDIPVATPPVPRLCTFRVPLAFAILDTGAVELSASGSTTGLGAGASASGKATLQLGVRRQLTLRKSLPVTQLSYKAGGDVLTYIIQAENSGDIALKNVTVTDPRLPDMACSASDLAKDAVLRCTQTSYTVQTSDVVAKEISNTAAASADKLGVTPEATARSSMLGMVVYIQSAAGGGQNFIATQYGTTDPIDFQVVIFNSGTAALDNPSLVVSDANGVTNFTITNCPTTSIQGGETRTCDVSVRPSQDNLDVGKPLDISATVTANSTESQASIEATADASDVAAYQNAAFEYTLTVDESGLSWPHPKAGDSVTYNLTLENKGNVLLSGIDLTAFAVNNKTLSFDGRGCATSLAAGAAAVQCSVTWNVTQDDIEAGQLKVTESVVMTYTSQTGTQTLSRLDGNPKVTYLSQNPSSAVTAPQELVTDSQGVERANGRFIFPGDVITITANVTNDGNRILNLTTQGVVCSSSVLNPGSQTTCTHTKTIAQADINHGAYSIFASIEWKAWDGTGAFAAGEFTIYAEDQSAMTVAVEIVSGSNFTSPGAVITYKLVITNTGYTPLFRVHVNDNHDTSSCVLDAEYLAPSRDFSCTRTYNVTQEDIDNGGVTITANGYAFRPSWSVADPRFLQDQPSITVPASQSPAANIAVETSRNTITFSGTTVTFTATISNPGNMRLTGISVTSAEVPAIGTGCTIPAQLDPGASFPCSAEKTFLQADFQNGANLVPAFVSTVNVSATQNNTAASAFTTVSFVKNPQLALTRLSTTSVSDRSATTIQSSVKVHNTGNWVLSNLVYSPGFSGCPTSLDPGAEETCTLAVPLAATDFDKESDNSDLMFTASVNDTVSAGAGTTVESQFQINKYDFIQHNPSLAAVLTPSPTSVWQEGTPVTFNATLTNSGNTAVTIPKASIQLSVGGRPINFTCSGFSGASKALNPGTNTQCISNSPVVTRFRNMLDGSIDGRVSTTYTSDHLPGTTLSAATDATVDAKVCDSSRAPRCPRFQASVVAGKLKPTYLGAFSATCNRCTATVTFKSPFQSANCLANMVNYVALAVGGRPSQCAKKDSVTFGDTVVLSGVSHGSRVFAYVYDSSYTANTLAPQVVFKDLGRPVCRVGGNGKGYCGRYGGFVVNCGSSCRRN